VAQIHRNLRTRSRRFSQNGRFPLFVKQGKFEVGVVPADGLDCLLHTIFFVFIKLGSLALSAGANPMNFRPI
jgi:hypothetical protein